MKKILVFMILVGVGVLSYLYIFKNEDNSIKSDNKMIDLSNMKIDEIKNYSKDNKLKLEIVYENNVLDKDSFIKQSIEKNKSYKENDKLVITLSKGIDLDKLKEDNINELGKVPVMMYHGISHLLDSDTAYTKGNIDSSGYNRTTESFNRDLEFYYSEGYEMIRLIDYVNGDINTSYGKSPIVLTFDDGHKNNFNVLGLDENGNLEIDPNCAVGILEKFKKKYPDFNVTATFFLNGGLFGQKEYNEQILNWLVDNGYDIGNHTKNHANLKEISGTKVEEEIGYMYELFDKIIKDKYVNIIALPFGNPTNKDHENFKYVLSSKYNGKTYNTLSALRVGWEPNVSPYSKDFDINFIKRVRAWDNNGVEFDIEMVFNSLKKTKYISDGNRDTIVIKKELENKIIESDKKIIIYE